MMSLSCLIGQLLTDLTPLNFAIEDLRILCLSLKAQRISKDTSTT
jgi:hypothetical protein